MHPAPVGSAAKRTRPMQPAEQLVSRSIQCTLALVVVALAGGCDVDPTTVTISPATATLEDIGKTVQLTATVEDQDGNAITDVTVTWSSSDTSVATVGSSGLVTGTGTGTATVQASAESARGTVPVTVEVGPRAVLLIVHEAMGGPGWIESDNWGTNAALDTWYGVTTNATDHVTELDLSDNGVIGAIPPEIDMLERLEYLDLSDNEVSGSIPSELGNLQNLQVLMLAENQLTGSIPTELGNLQNLVWFILASNEVSGSIPSELRTLQNLEALSLANNQLSGSIPPELGNLQDLEILWADSNQLSGSIPTELGNLQNLEVLSLANNQLSGSIPSELGNLWNLQLLYVDFNELTGSIPPELENIQNLLWLNLASNELAGSIPPELGNLRSLSQLELNSNPLSDRLPRDLIGLSLVMFHWDETDICAPSDNEFQDWLESIDDHEGGENCEEGDIADTSSGTADLRDAGSRPIPHTPFGTGAWASRSSPVLKGAPMGDSSGIPVRPCG